MFSIRKDKGWASCLEDNQNFEKDGRSCKAVRWYAGHPCNYSGYWQNILGQCTDSY